MTESPGPDLVDASAHVAGADVASAVEAMALTEQEGVPLEQHAGHLGAAQAALAALLESPSSAGPPA